MESLFSRHRNLIVLLATLLAQILGLAVQVRKPLRASTAEVLPGARVGEGGGVRLIRLWAADMVTPVEMVLHGIDRGVVWLWGDYLDLRHVRKENQGLEQTVDRLRLEQATLLEDARQGERLQELLHFQQSYVSRTIAAQVIGTSGSLQSHLLYLDKGAADGLRPDMAVISTDGIVGKVRDVFPHTAQVLMINDQTSGAGVILEKTRIRGILRGNSSGQPQVIDILADQRIQPGERVLTAGGDQIFPRGLAVGVVERVVRDPDRGSFIDVIVKPAAPLDRLDEVLVLTELQSELPEPMQQDLATSQQEKGAQVAAQIAAETARRKAAEEMAERLPGLEDPSAANVVGGPPQPATTAGGAGSQAPVPPAPPKPIPARHVDRFSPESAEGIAPAVSGQDAPAASAGQPATTKPATSKPATSKPAASKPAASGPGAVSARPPAKHSGVGQ